MSLDSLVIDSSMAYSDQDNQNFCIDVNFLPAIVKAEVKQRINRRRTAENREELIVDLTPRTEEAPSAEDLAMQADRRNRNNAAARKYRQKLRQRHSKIQKDYNKLKEERRGLEKEIEVLRRDNLFLLSIWKKHAKSCQLQALRQMGTLGSTIGQYETTDSRPTFNKTTVHKVNKPEFGANIGCQGVHSEINWGCERMDGARASQHAARHASLSSTGMSPTPSPLETPPSFAFTYTPEYTIL
ncbi:uncharacterized protein LOC135467028 [Liolophura sinensis]|uniref:uncharacterized protein LOC135467028 n=1 Tax=Liolophura sinensis TaxID=3198878 RepID=UPI003158117C